MLDGLRAIAVLWVVAVHCCQFVGIEWEWDAGRGGFFWRSGTARQLLWASWPMQVFLQGDLGVDVFFVLSGFLIYRLLALELEASGAMPGPSCSAAGCTYSPRTRRARPQLRVAAGQR